MLIITFYRYSFAYAASHFHFNSRPPLLLLLLNPAPTRFSLSLIALISVNCSHCGLRHSQFIKIASSVPGNKKRHQCVSSICLLESIFFFHCSCSSLVANRKMWALKSCSHFSRLRISRRAPINFKFLLAFNLLNLFPNTSSFFCGEASLTHVDARSLGRSDRLTRSMARENEAETIRSLKPLWWRCTDEWKAQHETFSLARLMSEELCVGGAGRSMGAELVGERKKMQMNLSVRKHFPVEKLLRNVFSERRDHLVCEKIEFPPSGRNFNSNQKLLSSVNKVSALLSF